MKTTIGAGRVPVKDIAAWSGGQFVSVGYDGDDAYIKYICTDSREVEDGVMLCAIRGERVDGHHYMISAHERGGRVFLCERVPEGMPAPYVCVVTEDTVAAMGRLAAGYRATHLPDLCPVAITGSVGKTTTKECVAAVLSEGGSVFKKEGNFNSTIGLPLTVTEMPPTGRSDSPLVAVLEMGMSGFGEIHAMSMAVSPRIALITNIGSSHLELLGSRENITRAKSEILDGMGAGDTLLINGDEPLLAMAAAHARARDMTCLRVSTTDPAADIYARTTSMRDDGMIFDVTFAPTVTRPASEHPITWHDLFIPAPGEHMVWAAGFAAAVGQLMGLTREAVARGLAAYRSAAMRQNIRTIHGTTVIEDCYNAAPESMRAALGVLALVQGRKIAVLGDMRELGKEEVALHRAVGEAVVAIGADLLVSVGPLGAHIGEGAVAAGMSPDKVWMPPPDTTPAAIAAYLAAHAGEGDTLLFKASRAMRLENVIHAFETSGTL